MRRALVVVLLISVACAAQQVIPTIGGSAIPHPGYYLDANSMCGFSPSDSNSGLWGYPWATLSHAVATGDLTATCSNLMICYPDGHYRSAPTVCQDFASGQYWPMQECSFPGCTDAILYEIFNGKNGTLNGIDGLGFIPQWKNSGMLVSVVTGSYQSSYASVANYSNYAPSSAATIISVQSNYYAWTGSSGGYWQGTPFSVSSGSNPQVGTYNPVGSSNLAAFLWGAYPANYIQQSISPLMGTQNVWSFICGGGHQTIYLNGVSVVTAPNSCTFSGSNISAYIGFDKVASYAMSGLLQGLMIAPSALSSGDQTAAEAYVTNDANHLTHALTPASDGYLASPTMELLPYAVYGAAQTEADFQADCLAMSTDGLAAAGYKYCQIIVGWPASSRSGGYLVPDPVKWPDGIKVGGCDYAHAHGMLCDVYLTPDGCVGLQPASAGYETQDASTVATAGADELEYDYCSPTSSAQTLYQTMQTAMLATGHRMAYFVSLQAALENSAQWCTTVGGNQLTVSTDLSTGGSLTWANLLKTIDQQSFGSYGSLGVPGSCTGPETGCGVEYYTADKPACWRSPSTGVITTAGLTDTQNLAGMSLYSFYGIALLIFQKPSALTANQLAILTNPNLIAMDQDPYSGQAGPRQDSSGSCGSATCQTYFRPGSNGSYYVGFLNRDTSAHNITFTFSNEGLTGTFNGYDLQAGSSLGSISTSYTWSSVPATGSEMMVLCPGSTTWTGTPPKCQ
jgi:alpha-galactosidase